MLPVVAFAMPLLLGGVGRREVWDAALTLAASVCPTTQGVPTLLGVGCVIGSALGMVGALLATSQKGDVTTWGCQKSIRMLARIFAVSSTGTVAKRMVGVSAMFGHAHSPCGLERCITWRQTRPSPVNF